VRGWLVDYTGVVADGVQAKQPPALGCPASGWRARWAASVRHGEVLRRLEPVESRAGQPGAVRDLAWGSTATAAAT
jgi:hypothetical protein